MRRDPASALFVLTFRERQRLHGRAYRAQQKDHREVGGVLVANGHRRLKLVFVSNRDDRPYRFRMTSRDVKEVRERLRGGEAVVGGFHSHPVGYATLGRRDIECSVGRYTLVYDVCGREARLWQVARAGKRRRVIEVAVRVATRRITSA